MGKVNDPFQDEIGVLMRVGGTHGRRDMIIWLMMGIFPVIMSATIINVAIPSLKAYFHASHVEIQVLSSTFLAAMTVALLLSGGLIGKLGVRTTFRWLMVSFMVTSLVAAILPPSGLVVLVGLRVLQGFITGMAQALAMLVLISIFPPHQRGQAIALYGLGIAFSPTIGPFVGGMLTSLVGWQSIFVFSLPLCAVSFLRASPSMPLGAPGDLPRTVRIWPVAWLCCFVVGLSGMFLVGLKQPDVALIFVVLALTGLTLFVRDQVSNRTQQVLNFALLKLPGVAAAALIAFAYGCGLYGTTYLLPVYLQELGHWTSLQAGVVLLPGGLMLGLMLYVGGVMSDRFSMRWTLFLGLVGFVVSNAAFWWFLYPVDVLLFVLFTIIGRIGLGLTMPSLTVGATAVAPPHYTSTVTVMVNFARALGGAVGVGLVGLLLEFGTPMEQPNGMNSESFRLAFLAMTLSFLPALVAWYWIRPVRSIAEAKTF